MIDPLMDPEDNSDLINRAAKNAKRSRIENLSNSDMPEELKEALKDHIDARIDDAKNLTPIEYRAVSATVDNLTNISNNFTSESQLAAVCELLDEMSDGHLSVLSAYYESRRQIILYTDITANLRLLIKFLASEDKPFQSNNWSHIVVLFDIYLDFCQFQLTQAIEAYRHFCSLLDKEVDELFIETGFLSERTVWDRLCAKNPPAWKDI